MRLIDADELKSLYDDAEFANEKWHVPIRVILANIDDMPTVDPVKHGRWIYTPIPMLGNPYGSYACSECFPYTQAHETKFCPNCGAKMDEVSE